MRATVMYGVGAVRVENVPDAQIIKPTDALVRVSRAASAAATSGPTRRWSRYSNGLVILGKIDGDVEAFKAPGSIKASIELVK